MVEIIRREAIVGPTLVRVASEELKYPTPTSPDSSRHRGACARRSTSATSPRRSATGYLARWARRRRLDEPALRRGRGYDHRGHGRWLAACQLGLTAIPVVRVHHLTPDSVRAYRIADNQLAALSGWDDDLLAIELQHLSAVELDFNLEVIGFDHPEIDLRIGPAEGRRAA